MLQAGWQGVLPHHAQLLAVLLQVPNCVCTAPPLQAQAAVCTPLFCRLLFTMNPMVNMVQLDKLISGVCMVAVTLFGTRQTTSSAPSGRMHCDAESAHALLMDVPSSCVTGLMLAEDSTVMHMFSSA